MPALAVVVGDPLGLTQVAVGENAYGTVAVSHGGDAWMNSQCVSIPWVIGECASVGISTTGNASGYGTAIAPQGHADGWKGAVGNSADGHICPAVAITGPATTWGYCPGYLVGLPAISVLGSASGSNGGISGTGNASGLVALSGTGTANGFVSASGTNSAWGLVAMSGAGASSAQSWDFPDYIHPGVPHVPGIAVSGLGGAAANGMNSVGISGSGNSTGNLIAISGVRNATSSDGVAISGSSTSGGLIGVGGANSGGSILALSQSGNASGGTAGISLAGSGSGSMASFSGNDLSGQVNGISFELTPEGALYDTSGDADYEYTFPGDFDDELSNEEGTLSTAQGVNPPFATSSSYISVVVGSSNDPIIVSAGTPGVGQDCGSKIYAKKNRYHSAAITRTGSGVDSHGHSYISYHLHFQSKWRDNTYSTRMKPYYTNHHTGRSTVEPYQEKNPWYFHVTRRVKPGGIVGFDAYSLFYPPVPSSQYPRGEVWGTEARDFWCVAR